MALVTTWRYVTAIWMRMLSREINEGHAESKRYSPSDQTEQKDASTGPEHLRSLVLFLAIGTHA